jgi:hypothetical protein
LAIKAAILSVRCWQQAKSIAYVDADVPVSLIASCIKPVVAVQYQLAWTQKRFHLTVSNSLPWALPSLLGVVSSSALSATGGNQHGENCHRELLKQKATIAWENNQLNALARDDVDQHQKLQYIQVV